MSYMLVNHVVSGDRLHRGSMPNLLPPPRSDSLWPRHLRKRLSADLPRTHALNSSPIRWPSLVTMCKWKQSLTERLLKRHRGSLSCFQESDSAVT
ncbi:hypothetical protein GN956_G24600 [Arapaima gigas]